MKYLFVVIACVLGIAAIGTYLSYPEVRNEVPVLYWVTDQNPARLEQIRQFHLWQIEQRLGEQYELKTVEDVRLFRESPWSDAMIQAICEANPGTSAIWDEHAQALTLPMTVDTPMYELRTDSVNKDTSKQVIQGVSGVGGDIMDIGSGENLRYFQTIGLLEDVTDQAHVLGFDPTHTYPAIETEITSEGRQYSYPCNVLLPFMLWVNEKTIREFGLEPLPHRWTFEQFESLGKRFVQAANTPGERQTVFFVDRLDPQVLYRSLGLSRYNETMTRCVLDDKRYVRVLKLIRKWTDEDHLMPSALEKASFTAESGYAGPTLTLFDQGRYAMFGMGRYALIQLRGYDRLELDVVEMPNGGFPNTIVKTRAASIYAGGQHKDMAGYFLAYLASQPYNDLVVRDADGLPPNPVFTEGDAFNQPSAHPNEWGVHKVFVEAVDEIAIGGAYSPFILSQQVSRIEREAREAFMNDLISAEEAARRVADQVNEEIQRRIARDRSGELSRLYEQLSRQQAEIDALRAEGKPVPLKLIENPYYKRYYTFKGLAE